MAVRLYAGWDIDEALINDPGLVQHLEATASQWAAVLATGQQPDSPGFFVWATRDPLDAPLQRVQMMKGWIDDAGQTHENVVDIACADGLRLIRPLAAARIMVPALICRPASSVPAPVPLN